LQFLDLQQNSADFWGFKKTLDKKCFLNIRKVVPQKLRFPSAIGENRLKEKTSQMYLRLEKMKQTSQMFSIKPWVLEN
jgi:hypothetical protein